MLSFLVRQLSLCIALVCLASFASASCPDPQAALSEACPELYAELDHEGLVNRLDLASDTPALPQTVEQLRSILANQQRAVKTLPSVDEAELERTLSEYYQAAERKEPSFMDQLSAWWDELFGDKQERMRPDSEFWSQLLPSKALAHVLFYGLSGLILAMIVVYGWREIAPFVAQRRALNAIKVPKNVVSMASRWPPEVDGLSSAGALGKAYSALVAVLTARKQLPPIPGLTHNELANQFKPTQSQAVETFGLLSQQAGEILFAQHAVSPEQFQQFMARADQLVQQEKTNA